MLTVVEIILTIVAWKRGWKGWALLPLGLVMILAFVIGASVGVTGGDVEDVLGACLLLEVLATIALGVMIAKAPQKTTASYTSPAEAAKEPVKNV